MLMLPRDDSREYVRQEQGQRRLAIRKLPPQGYAHTVKINE